MFEPIPFFGTERQIVAPQTWLKRAAQARRIGLLLSGSDAAVVEAYARECEEQAAALVAAPVPVLSRIAA